MKLLLLSDLHIEYNAFEIPNGDYDVIVLAGDVHLGTTGIDWIKFNSPVKPVIYVLGNHEYYGRIYPDLIYEIRDKVKTIDKTSNIKIHFLENRSVEIDGVVFHGATLWTDFNLFENTRLAPFYDKDTCGNYAKSKLDDFGKIDYRSDETAESEDIRHNHMISIHECSMEWLKGSLLKNKGKKNVVVTHHAPSRNSLSSGYAVDKSSTCFASDLEDFILKYKPDFWLHGHVHHSCDYPIGNTKVVCHSRGYKGEENFEGYRGKTITVCKGNIDI